MSSAIYPSVTQSISTFGFVATAIVNLSLLYITTYKIEKLDFGYKLLVSFFLKLCLVLSFIGMFLHPFYHTHNAGLIAFNTRYGITKSINNIIMAAYSGVCLAIISFFSILFTYRFWTMTNSRWTLRFNNWKSLTLVPYALFVGIMSTYFFIHLGSIDKTAEDYFREALLENYNVTIEKVSGNAIIAFTPNATGKWYQRINWNSYLLTHLMISTMTFQFIVVTYCGVRTHFAMEELIERLSPACKRFQKQIYKCLVLQITPPILAIFLPIVVIFSTPYLDIQMDFPTGIVVVLFNLYPLFDSIVMIVIVSEYRTAIKKCIQKYVIPPLAWLIRDRDEPQRNEIQLQTFATFK